MAIMIIKMRLVIVIAMMIVIVAIIIIIIRRIMMMVNHVPAFQNRLSKDLKIIAEMIISQMDLKYNSTIQVMINSIQNRFIDVTYMR